MSRPDVINLSSDDESDAAALDQENTFAGLADIKDVKFLLPPLGAREEAARRLLLPVKREPAENLLAIGNGVSGSAPSTSSSMPPPPTRLCRQFWRSGDYELVPATTRVVTQNGRNRLRINPRFLHSNATSHKWAFGAIAELLDNAMDEVSKGATTVHVDKFINPRDRTPALLIQDDGGGMDPESLRRCMSFGFSDKQSESFIGQYGNGFKTSTMRLGSDVIVFTRSKKNGISTQSVGLLSYTFLRETGADDIVVPTVDYEFDTVTASFGRLLRHDAKQFTSALSAILRWSPFPTEADLERQFNDIGEHGTKIIVFNLWLNDDGNMELDFNSDKQDILISGIYHPIKMNMNNTEKMRTRNYVATQLRYSLRVYASVLYLKLLENFTIVLRGKPVEPHNITNDLIYRECILYRPQISGVVEAAILTTIGFLKGAPNIDVQGFNVYHKNRLILPFWKVCNNSYGKGRGVVGILEANFIKPTHDKQDFEKSALYQKLETRLKDMTYEYWDIHSHKIGYDNKKKPKEPTVVAASPTELRINNLPPMHAHQLPRPYISSNKVALSNLETSTSKEMDLAPHKSIKRKHNFLGSSGKHVEDLTACNVLNVENDFNKQDSRGDKQKRFHEIKALTLQNKKLQDQCMKYEEAEKELILKEQKLRADIDDAQIVYQKLLEQLKLFEVNLEK